jgi:hypothetical protein
VSALGDPAVSADPRSWAAPKPSGVRRFLPIVRWLPAYDRRFLRFDVIAGATVWGLLVPESIAAATIGVTPWARAHRPPGHRAPRRLRHPDMTSIERDGP